jgi:hypothetical protein
VKPNCRLPAIRPGIIPSEDSAGFNGNRSPVDGSNIIISEQGHNIFEVTTKGTTKIFCAYQWSPAQPSSLSIVAGSKLSACNTSIVLMAVAGI